MTRRDYGEGSVYQRTDGRWAGVLEAGYTERGTRRRITVTAKTEAAAKRKLRDRRAEISRARGRTTEASKLRQTVKGWSDEWLQIRQDTKRPNTYLADRGNVRNWIVPTIGHKRLAELTARDVRAVEARIRGAKTADGKPIGTSTVLRVQRTLVKMLRDAMEDAYPVDPAMLKVSAKGKPRNDRQALETVQAIAVMLHAADLPQGVRWYVGFYEGLRQGEALGLTWDSLDFENKLIVTDWQLQPLPYRTRFDRSSGFRVPHDYEARQMVGRFHLTRPKTEAGARVIPMTDTVREALLRYRETWTPNPHGLLFTREDGWPIDAKDDTAQFHALQAAAGVRHPSGRPYTGHEMRNTTVTLLYELDVAEPLIEAIVGHTSARTSRGYRTDRTGPKAAAMAALDAAFAPKAIEG